MKLKKYIGVIIFLCAFLFFSQSVYAFDYKKTCTSKNAQQVAKIVYNEVGADLAKNPTDNFYARVNTAAIIVNNANGKNSDDWYQKLLKLTDSNYHNYSTYKNESFESVVPEDKRSEMLYVAELALTGKYTLPSNMVFQASKSIVSSYGTIWDYVDIIDGAGIDIYFGYSGDKINGTDVYGNTLSNVSVGRYRQFANVLKNTNSTTYTVNNVCTNYGGGGNTPVIDNSGSDSDGNSEGPKWQREVSTIVDACTNPEILKVIQFFMIIIDIVKIAVPIGLIVIGMIDFSRAVATSDEATRKKSTSIFVKRLLYSVLIFAVPWIVNTLIVYLGNITGDDINFTDCLENANADTIKQLEDGTYEKYSCYYCDVNGYLWNVGKPDNTCDWTVKRDINSSLDCTDEAEACYYCSVTNKYIWNAGLPNDGECPGGIKWQKKDNSACGR